jgi:uncharacterized OB-fold protein
MAESTSLPVSARILPPLNDLNRPFWTGGARGELLILRCPACRYWVHPPASPCPGCGSDGLVPEAVSGKGTVFTYTVNWHPFNPEVPVPVLIAIVELPEQEGLRFTTNIVGCGPDDVRVGLPVEVRFEQHGEVWVPVFTPDPEP